MILSIVIMPIAAAGQNYATDSLIKWIHSHPTVDSQYILNLHRISYRLCETDIKRSYEYYQKVAFYSDSIDFVYGKSLAKINLGILYHNSTNYDASNTVYLEALAYAKKCNSMRLRSVSLNNLAQNFRELQNITKCKQYLKEAADINIQLKAWRGAATNFELLQECDFEDKLYDSAKHSLVTGLPYALLADEHSLLSMFYNGFGKMYAINNQPDSAEWYFSRALAEAGRDGNLRSASQALFARATYTQNINFGRKKILLAHAMQIAQQGDYPEGVADVAKYFYDYYNEIGKTDSSMFYYKIYRNTTDSILSDHNLRKLRFSETEWAIKKKDLLNQQLKDYATLQDKEIILKTNYCSH
ncbi:MAG: hypothetical protein V4722_26905 [Bacteroidota bacterium]